MSSQDTSFLPDLNNFVLPCCSNLPSSIIISRTMLLFLTKKTRNFCIPFYLILMLFKINIWMWFCQLILDHTFNIAKSECLFKLIIFPLHHVQGFLDDYTFSYPLLLSTFTGCINCCGVGWRCLISMPVGTNQLISSCTCKTNIGLLTRKPTKHSLILNQEKFISF